MRLPTSVSCAVRALRTDIFSFDVNYPLISVPAAGPRDSLHYYLYGDALSWSAMRMDGSGIPRTWSRTFGTAYCPGYIAWYGLVNLGHYLRHNDERFLTIFLKQIDWLERNAMVRSDGAVVWPMPFDHREGKTRLRGPWISAHPQGLAISAVVRGWRVTRRRSLLQLLRGASRIFQLDVSRDGIRQTLHEHVLYTEIPGGPAPGILDGFLTSLLGLYDLLVETEDSTVQRLFQQGLNGLRAALPLWDYRGKWSWYGCREYLSPPAYHCLNRLLVQVVGGVANVAELRRCAERWDPANLSPLDHAEIRSLFVLTKNLSRLRHHTWTQPSYADSAEEPALLAG